MAILTKPKGSNYVIRSNYRNTVIGSKTSKQQQTIVRCNSKMLKENNGISFSQYKKNKVGK